MKKFIILIFTIFFTNSLFAQVDTSRIKVIKDSLLNGKTNLNFAVPDAPAFKALGTDPSDVLRPSNPKDFSLIVGNFFNSKFDGIIPQNLAVEITPGLLTKPWYTLNQYQSNGLLRAWTKTRFSIGTNKDYTTGINSLSLGLRTTLLDNGDFRLNKQNNLQEVYKIQGEITEKLAAKKLDYLKQNNMSILSFAELDTASRNRIMDSLLVTIGKEEFDSKITNVVEQFKKQNWNASRIDLATAILFNSPDSLLGNAKFNKFLFWLSAALKMSTNSQLLLGIHNNFYTTNNKTYNTFVFNARYYLGKNTLKGFLEAQYKESQLATNTTNKILYSALGLELAIKDGIWLHFATGIENLLDKTEAKSQFRTNMNLYFTLPELVKIF